MAKYKPKVNLAKDSALINSAKFVQSLKRQGEHVLKAAKQALRIGVDEIVSDAKVRCPVRTGTLQSSITAKAFSEGTGYIVSARALNNKGIDYAQYVEFDPRINKPFMYPAVKENRGKIYKMINAAVRVATRRGNS